jgi:copper(I)-binding protein
MKRLWWLLLVWSVGVNAGTLEIREGYVREMPPGQSTSAAFMKLVNTGDKPVAIVAAASDSAGSAEMHAHSQHNGMMQMKKVSRVEVPARGQLVFAPGGYHLMLINLKRSLKAGEQVGITLFDEQGKFYNAKLPVVNMVGESAEHHH